MENNEKNQVKILQLEEKEVNSIKGMPLLIVNTLVFIICLLMFVFGVLIIDGEIGAIFPFGCAVAMVVIGALVGFIICPILYGGLKIIRPNEALVFTLFGKYVGTLKGEGFYFVNPFCVAVAPATAAASSGTIGLNSEQKSAAERKKETGSAMPTKRLSLKAITLNNERQKINDCLGNPIIIGIVVIWRVTNTAKAMFNVDNYFDFLSIQCDSALRNIVRLYPYDLNEEGNEKSLRGSSVEIADKLKSEIQEKVEIAGLEVMEARITHLSYAPEIAAAMLQRQQATAIVDARQLIVEGAVGMVKTALDRLNEDEIVSLDEERKAQMVSNLLVVLCGNRDAQPIVNSGTIY